MTCMDCGGALKVTRAPYRYRDSGLPGIVLLGVEVRRCQKCGAEEVAIPPIEELHRLIAQALPTPLRLQWDRGWWMSRVA
jgi:hypothetical protein